MVGNWWIGKNKRTWDCLQKQKQEDSIAAFFLLDWLFRDCDVDYHLCDVIISQIVFVIVLSLFMIVLSLFMIVLLLDLYLCESLVEVSDDVIDMFYADR